MTSTVTPVALVQEMYSAFGRGDIAFILQNIAPDCQWVAPGTGIPNAGVYEGPAGVAQFFQKLAESETVTLFEPREFFTSGDDVIALGREECTINANKKSARTNWAMLFRVRDGKVVYWESFYDTAAYLTAHRG